MVNRVTITGNLGADPEIRTTQAGGRIANFRVAVTTRWRSKEGEAQERTQWIPCVVTGQVLVGVVESKLFKGTKVFVEGEWQTRKFTDKQGVERYTTEVFVGNPGSALEFFSGPAGGSGGAPDPQGPAPRGTPAAGSRQRAQQAQGNPMGSEPPDYDEDPLPF